MVVFLPETSSDKSDYSQNDKRISHGCISAVFGLCYCVEMERGACKRSFKGGLTGVNANDDKKPFRSTKANSL